MKDCSIARAVAPGDENAEKLLTFEDVSTIAHSRGMEIGLQEIGPFYKIQCWEGNREGALLGVTDGFLITPLRLMHCDKMQIFTRGKGGEEGNRQRVGILGLGTLLGAAVFAYGHAKGCCKAEILAINDDEYTHSRLKRYYSRVFGFREIREVGENGLRDLPDLLVWGGVGTRMNGDVQFMLEKCSRTFKASKASNSKQG